MACVGLHRRDFAALCNLASVRTEQGNHAEAAQALEVPPHVAAHVHAHAVVHVRVHAHMHSMHIMAMHDDSLPRRASVAWGSVRMETPCVLTLIDPSHVARALHGGAFAWRPHACSH